MSLIRDNDDERRSRVEALICELLRPGQHTPAQPRGSDSDDTTEWPPAHRSNWELYRCE